MATGTQAEDRIRKIELDHATLNVKVDSLFDNLGSPGLISQLRIALSQKIDEYFQPVSKFIESEPARNQHIKNNANEAVMNAKHLAEEALKRSDERSDEKVQRLHDENKKTAEKADRKVDELESKLERHEKFVQRGIGIVIFSQVMMLIGGFCIAVFTFVGGAVWWFFTHVAVKP